MTGVQTCALPILRNDFGPDSGLFLRSTEDGTAFQAMIDYHTNGNLMGIYAEGRLGAQPSVRNFSFAENVTDIQEIHTPVPPSLPVLPEAWSKFWRHGQWNELRARIVGNPPHITTRINGVMFCDWQETGRRHPDAGGHRAAGARGRGLHPTVCSLSQYPREKGRFRPGQHLVRRGTVGWVATAI